MPVAVVVAPLLVAATLLLSGLLKLSSGRDLARAFADLEVPAALSGPWVVRAVPLVEVLLGVGLVAVPAPLFTPVAILALLLTLAYLVLVARAVLRGRQVDCDCFGALTDSRVTVRTVARNLVLVVAAVLSVAEGLAGGSALQRLLDLPASGWGWLAAAVATGGFVALLQPQRSAAPEPAAVPVPVDDGRVRGIPYLVLERPDGSPVSLPELASLRPQLLVTLSTSCTRCLPVTEEIGSWPVLVPEVDVRVVSVVPAGAPVPETWPNVLHDLDDRLLAVLGMGRPSAVLLGADALVAGGPVHGASAVRDLVEEIREHLAASRQAEAPGDAPESAR